MVQVGTSATSISIEDVQDALDRYPSLVPDDLEELDRARFETIPAAVASRLKDPTDGDDAPSTASLTKADLLELVKWKLKHGKFRPSLFKLADSNDEASIQKSTASAFRALQNDSGSALSPAAVQKAMDAVQTLKGIGPATASLILSTAPGANVPFFSDELFRFCLRRRADGKVDWQAKISYSQKEFNELCSSVTGLLKGLGQEITTAKLEKAAWVWARDDGHGSGPKAVSTDQPSTRTSLEAEIKASPPRRDKNPSTVKRKATVQEEPRRSKRHR